MPTCILSIGSLHIPTISLSFSLALHFGNVIFLQHPRQEQGLSLLVPQNP